MFFYYGRPIVNSKESFMTSTAMGQDSYVRARDAHSAAKTDLVLQLLLGFMAVAEFAVGAFGKTVVEWDFSKGAHGWAGNRMVKDLTSSPEGLVIKSQGDDPWIEGPAVDLPGEETKVTILMKSDADTSGELFYGREFAAERSIRFTVQNDNQWHDYHLIIRERLGAGTRFRLDPCAGKGQVTVAYINIESISKMPAPPLEKPMGPDKTKGTAGSVKSGVLEFEHYKGGWGHFAIKVDGIEMAAGCECELLGLRFDDRGEWLNLKNAEVTSEKTSEGEFISKAGIKDSGGAMWEIRRCVRAGKKDGTLIIETELRVDKDRAVVHIPWLTIFPGLGTFGEHKYQGLLAGVEYLSDEPSSSDADIAGPQHIRRVPDAIKITFPLMAISHNGNFIGVIWEPSDLVAATFDSPDRIYNSGAHVMALSAPAVGQLCFENDFYAYMPLRIEANKPLKTSAIIIGGKGKTVVPAVKLYVELKTLPDVPEFEGGFEAAVNLLAHGWLDSQVNVNGLFRHAVWGNAFGPTPAADAVMFIDWLENHTKDETLRERLTGAKQLGLSKIPPEYSFSSAISHPQPPTAPFIFGRLCEFVQQRRNEALALLNHFDPNGVKLYRPGATDFSKTHFEKHANGYSGRDMVRILEGAALSGDKELISKALELLDKQTSLYADTVPRGAQTWEVPLHTPDILASAHLVKAYTLGYIISGKKEYLEQARYWAWTGVPFVYLYPPTSGEVGTYATTAVLGATNWAAPVWIGLPVQWCGLDYCSALHLLSEYDRQGPWEKIAKGITATGLQMSWPLTHKDHVGLLPDSFQLREQIRAGPAINPGTVQAHVTELYGKGKIYDVKKVPERGWFIHAPCMISDIRRETDSVTFTVDGWGDKPYYVLVSGVKEEPHKVETRPVVFLGRRLLTDFQPAEKRFYADYGTLTISLKGKSEVRIR
jgi:hypothetical protein